MLDNSARPALLAIYLVTAFWLGGVLAARVGRLAIPLGLGIIALLTAAYAVDPFLYAALLIEMAVLGSVPLLTPPGRPVGRGVSALPGISDPGDDAAAVHRLDHGWGGGQSRRPCLGSAGITFLGLGFALLLAVIPFQTWIPMLAEEAHPYAAGLIFLMLPEMIMLFGLSFLDRYAWLRECFINVFYLRLAG